MNILVTGGAGFIGSHMAQRHLADGHRVVIVDDLSSGRRETPSGRRALRPGRHRRGRPRAAAARGEDRLRLAPCRADRPAPQRRRPDRRRPREHHRKPEALRGHAARRDAPASSSPRPAARSTASRRAAGPRPRATRPIPISPYGCAKLSIEKYMHYYRVVHGFQTQVFRYANVYGPWQDGTGEAGVVAIFSEAMLGSRPLKINGDGEQTRDYVFVGDLVEAAAARGAKRRRAASGTSAPGSRPPSTASSSCSRRSTATPRRRPTSRRRRASRCAASSTAPSCGATSACRPGPPRGRPEGRPRSSSGTATATAEAPERRGAAIPDRCRAASARNPSAASRRRPAPARNGA